MVRPRSVIPGRQRWDVAVVLGRADVAQLVEAELRDRSGVTSVRANPVTGRVLVFHDPGLSSEEVGRLVRQAVGLTVRSVRAGSSVAGPEVGESRVGRRSVVPGWLALAGGGALAVAVGSSLLRSPLVRLGAVLAATAVVVARAWRESRNRSLSGAQGGAVRNPLTLIVRSHRRRFWMTSALTVVGQVLFLAPAMFIGWMFSVLTAGPSALLVRLGLTSAAGQLWFLAGVTASILVAYAVVSFIAGVLWRDLAQTVQHEWRAEMYARVQRAEMRYLEGERTTRLTGVLTADVDQLGRFLAGPAADLLQLATSLVVLTAVFLIAAPGLAWIAFLPMPVIAWLSFFYQERVAPGDAASSESGSLLNGQLVNTLEASATVKSFGTEDYEIGRMTRLSEAYARSNRGVAIRSTAYSQTVQVCGIVSFVGILLFGGLGVLEGGMSFEVYNALIGLPYILLSRLPGLGGAVEEYQKAVAALRRVLELGDLPVEPGGTGRALDVATVQGEMILEGVTFAYPGRSPVLEDLSLRVAAGKTTGIVGITGAGKTTIAKLLLRLQEVGAGRVVLDGVDVRDLRLQDLRAAIGFVSQEAFLFDGTVGDNIRYGTFDADAGRVAGAARLAEAEGFIEGLPERYDTMIGERGVTLSGGQRQRISLARAIVKAAPILILDEATSSVDNETEAAIQHALGDFARERTLIIVAHRLSTIRHADWIYVVGAGGGIVEEGTHAELLERNGVYASLWRLQIGEAT